MNKMNLKSKIANNRTAVVASAVAMSAMCSQAMCASDITAPLKTVLALIWVLTTFTGLVMIAIGTVQLIRCVIALTGGDQLQPGQLGKAIGLIAAGLAAALLETIVKTLAPNTSGLM